MDTESLVQRANEQHEQILVLHQRILTLQQQIMEQIKWNAAQIGGAD